MGVGPFAFRYQGNGAIGLPTANILIPLERQLIPLQRYVAAGSFYIMKYNETLHQTSRPLLSKLSKDDKFMYLIPILRKLGAAENLG